MGLIRCPWSQQRDHPSFPRRLHKPSTQHYELERVESPEGAEGLDRAGTAHEVDVAASVGRAHGLEEPLRDRCP